MKELQFKHHSAAACYQRYRYYGNRSHGNHRTLVGIEILFHGCTDVFNFVAQATLAAGMLKDAEDLEFVEYLGGSTYRAFVSDAEGKAWLLGFVREMGLTQAIIAAHRRTTGRLDFHILTPDRDETGRRLLTAENRVRARLVATGLTEELNKHRLAEKRFVLGNIRVGPYHREVYYLKKEDLQPQLEIETKTPEAPVAEVEVTTVPPKAPGASSPTTVPGGLEITGRETTVPPDKKTEETKKPAETQKAPPRFIHFERPASEESDEEKERKKREKEQEEERAQLRTEAKVAELQAWLMSIPEEGEAPPKEWLAYAKALGLPVAGVTGRVSLIAFLKALPRLLVDRRLDQTLQPADVAKLDGCRQLAGYLVQYGETGRTHPGEREEPGRDRRGPERD